MPMAVTMSSYASASTALDFIVIKLPIKIGAVFRCKLSVGLEQDFNQEVMSPRTIFPVSECSHVGV